MVGRLDYSEEEVELSKIRWAEERAGAKLEPQEYLVLKQSIEQLGLLHPIIVAKCEDGYHGVSGYHRWKAMMEKGIEKAKVRVIQCDQKNMILVEIIENYGRGRGDDWGLLKRLAELMEKHKMTLQEISQITGYSVSTLSKMMRVYKKSPPKILELIKEGKLGIWHALELLRLKDPITMIEYADMCARYRWSVRELRETIDRYLETRELYYQELLQDTGQEQETPFTEPQYMEPQTTQQEPYTQEYIEPQPNNTQDHASETVQAETQNTFTETQDQQETQEENTTTNQGEPPKCFFCNKPIKGIPITITTDKNCLIIASVLLRKLSEYMDKPIHRLKPADTAILDQITEMALKYLEQQENSSEAPPATAQRTATSGDNTSPPTQNNTQKTT